MQEKRYLYRGKSAIKMFHFKSRLWNGRFHPPEIFVVVISRKLYVPHIFIITIILLYDFIISVDANLLIIDSAQSCVIGELVRIFANSLSAYCYSNNMGWPCIMQCYHKIKTGPFVTTRLRHCMSNRCSLTRARVLLKYLPYALLVSLKIIVHYEGW
jgi:hypothetical protein